MKYLTMIVGIAILASVLYGYILLRGPRSNIQPTLEADGGSSAMQKEAVDVKKLELQGTDRFSFLWDQDEALECSIQLESDEGQIEGTYFTDGDSIRADFLVPTADFDGSILSSMIIHKGELLVWSEIEGSRYGVRLNKQDVGSSELPVSKEEVVTYDCRGWELIDNTVFQAPNDVLFRDGAELKETGMEYGTIYETSN